MKIIKIKEMIRQLNINIEICLVSLIYDRPTKENEALLRHLIVRNNIYKHELDFILDKLEAIKLMCEGKYQEMYCDGEELVDHELIVQELEEDNVFSPMRFSDNLKEYIDLEALKAGRMAVGFNRIFSGKISMDPNKEHLEVLEKNLWVEDYEEDMKKIYSMARNNGSLNEILELL